MCRLARLAGRLRVAWRDKKGWPWFDIDETVRTLVIDKAQVARPRKRSGGRSKRGMMSEQEFNRILADFDDFLAELPSFDLGIDTLFQTIDLDLDSL